MLEFLRHIMGWHVRSKRINPTATTASLHSMKPAVGITQSAQHYSLACDKESAGKECSGDTPPQRAAVADGWQHCTPEIVIRHIQAGAGAKTGKPVSGPAHCWNEMIVRTAAAYTNCTAYMMVCSRQEIMRQQRQAEAGVRSVEALLAIQAKVPTMSMHACGSA